MRSLHDKRPFDVLVIPSLVYRDARIRPVPRHVEWDGVQRTLKLVGYFHKHGSLSMTTGDFRGKMAAISLHLGVYDASGTQVFDSFGGLDLVHEVDIGTPGRTEDLTVRPELPTYEFRLMRSRLSDREAIREGIAMAFTPYLDPPAKAAASTDVETP